MAGLLWDGRDEAGARHNLRQTLLVLRRRLGADAAAAIASDGTSIELRLDAIDLDLRGFVAGCRSFDVSALSRACALYRGAFCERLDAGSDAFEEWLAVERARLGDLAAAAFHRLATLQRDAGDIDAAVASARRLVDLSPVDDDAHALLIELYRRRGQPGLARDAHQRCVELFQRELGERPGRQVEAALQQPVGRGRPVALPSLEDSTAPAQEPPIVSRRSKASMRHTVLGGVLAAVLALGSAAMLRTGSGPPESAPPESPIATPSARDPFSDGSGWREPAIRFPKTPAAAAARREEITRALELDPAYVHLFPAGC